MNLSNGPRPIKDWTPDMKKDFWDFIQSVMKSNSLVPDEPIYDVLIVGSVARGDCNYKSDIDVVVLMKNSVTSIIRKMTDNFKKPYRNFTDYSVFTKYQNIPVGIYIADKDFDNLYHGHNITIFSLKENRFIDKEINKDDRLYLKKYKQHKILAGPTNFENLSAKLNAEEDTLEYKDAVLSNVEYMEENYISQISKLVKLFSKCFKNKNFEKYNVLTLCGLDVVPSCGNLKIVNFNTNCLITEEVVNNLDFSVINNEKLSIFKKFNFIYNILNTDYLKWDVQMKDIILKTQIKDVEYDYQEGFPSHIKVKESDDVMNIKMIYDVGGLLDMFAKSYGEFRKLMLSNGLDRYLPIQDKFIEKEKSKFPQFVLKGLYFPGMSNHHFFDESSIFYKKNKKYNTRKFFEEFIVPDVYNDKNIMIRFYFLIGSLGCFNIGKTNLYHTIHPLKNEDGRYVWVYN